MMDNCATMAVVKADLGIALAERCMAENRYPVAVAREWLILNPFGGTHYALSELVDLIDDCMTTLESED